MFYDVFVNLCQTEKIAPSNLLKSLNLSTGNLQKWKDGATVNSDILITLSKHFGVTTDYLLGLDEHQKEIPDEAEKERNINMENKEFEVDTIKKFILNIKELTQNNKIKWEIERPQYDNSKLSQKSLCIRLTANFYCRKFTLVSKDDKFNFEIIFNDAPDIVEELPHITNEIIQEEIKELYEFIIYRPEIYDNFNELFNKSQREVKLWKY